MSEFRFFGTDEDKKEFVIFELDREDIANLYFWVTVSGKREGTVEVEPVSRIFSYLNHLESPFWVIEDDVKEIVEKAMKIIDEYPKDKLKEQISDFEDSFNNEDGSRDRWYENWDNIEKKIWEEVEKARSGDGYWPVSPEEY